MNQEPSALCHRCEYRAQHRERGHAPRCECGSTGAVCGCYMYKPVQPLVVTRSASEKRLHKRGRPVGGPWMLGARMQSKGLLPAKLVGKLLDEDSVALYWRPIRERKKS